MKKRILWKAGLVFLATAFLAFSGGASCCLAAQENKAAQAGGQKKVFDAHDTGVRFHSAIPGLSVPVIQHPRPAVPAIYPRHKTPACRTHLGLVQHLTPGTLAGNDPIR